MSILPSHTHQGSSSSSTNSLPQNPNFNHGNPPISNHQHPHQLHQPLSGPESSMPISISGSVHSATSSSRSSKRMIGHGKSSDGYTSRSQSINGKDGFQSVAEGVGSPQSVGESSESPPNGKSSGIARRRSQMVNGNYLLNFQYNPISRPQQRAPPRRKSQKIKPYKRDLFLQANYKFVVLDSGSYTLESMDPDKMLQWEDIICVRYSTPQPVQCPICLDDPLCPQITSCGHIFCFPCILRYLLMGEDNHKAECWRKCPLCFVMISSKDLYTVYIENVSEHKAGDTLEFMLLTRRKDSFSLHENVKGDASSKTHDPFSKFILTLDVDLSVREAISALDSWLARADSGLVDDLEKLPFVCVAMEQLKQRKKCWNAHKSSSSNTSSKISNCKAVIGDPDSPALALQRETLSHIDDLLKETNKLNIDIVHDGSGLVQSFDTDVSLEGQEALSSSYADNKNLQSQEDFSRDSKERNSYNFYQAADGQPIVLHPLNIKCLLHHYGSYDLLPKRVSGRILQLESVTQSEAMRKRYRHLSHFPLTTAFQLCEIDLREFLPADALSPFMDEIKKREKQRKWLAKKEQEDREKAEAVAAYSLPVSYDIGQGSFDGPSTFSMDDFEALGSNTTAVVSSPPVHGGRQLFSNVARLGFAAGCDSPSPSRQSVERNSAAGAYNGPAQGQGALSFANVISRERSTETTGTQTVNEVAKKVKKQSRVLLSTAGGRRY